MSWTAALSDATAVEKIYSGEVPELKGVHVHEVKLKRDGPQVVVQLDLPTYPPAPPAKWRAQGFNTVQVEIVFVGARDIRLDGFGRDPVADFEIESREGSLEISISSQDFSLRLAAVAAMLTRVSAYLDG